MKCCICGVKINGYGNNPEGAMWKTPDGKIVEGEFDSNDRCCDDCDQRFVIPGRMYRIAKERENK